MNLDKYIHEGTPAPSKGYFQTELLGPFAVDTHLLTPGSDNHGSASVPTGLCHSAEAAYDGITQCAVVLVRRTAVNATAGRLKPQTFVISHLEDELGRTRSSCQ